MTPATAAGRHTAAIHESILMQMSDGVLTIDLSGIVVSLNPAAGAILGLDPAEVLGRPFAETFLVEPCFETLTELVLKAIYEAETIHSEELELERGGLMRSLSVSTTFLTTPSEEGGERIGVIAVLRDITAERRRQRLQRLFGEYLDPRIIRRLVDQAQELELGSRTEVTVSFLDLEGFTGLSERLAAPALVRFLNTYIATMARPIGDRSGVTDKYIGDAIMAFWGPPFTPPSRHAAEACAAALEQRARLPAFREALRADAELAGVASGLEMRAGLATGGVVMGSIGSTRARNYTVVGDPVNLAARLEAANKALGTRILVAEATREAAGDLFAFRAVDILRVRGRSRPEPVFELMAPDAASDAASARLIERFELGLGAYRGRDWDLARRSFRSCLDLAPEDGPSSVFLRRLELLERHPPSESWDGSWSVVDGADRSAG
jgi:adenylate cyclase